MFLFRPELQEFKSAQEDLATSDMMPFIALCHAISPAQENLIFQVSFLYRIFYQAN